MRYLVVAIILSIFVNASDMDRIDDIVKEIETLRKEHDKCKELLYKERLKNTILIAKNDLLNKKNEKESKKDYKLVKTKEIKNISLENKNLNKKNSEDKIIKTLENKINQENKTKKIAEKEIFSKASTYRTIKNSNIYNAVNGKILYEWERNIAFTSNIMTQNWVKITGYFVDDKWKKAKQRLWIKKINIVKR